MLKSKSKAFTVVELVVVIAVIAVLAAVLIPVFSNVVDSARQSAALSECRNALEEYISITLGQGDSDNEDLSGCAFSHNGYFYVYLNTDCRKKDFVCTFTTSRQMKSVTLGIL